MKTNATIILYWVIKRLLIIALFVASYPNLAEAQQVPNKTDKTHQTGAYRLYLKDGSLLIGKIIKSGRGYFIFETRDLGQVKVYSKSVLKLTLISPNNTQIDSVVAPQWYDNRMNNHKYFISTTGFNPRRNDFYLEDTYVFLVGARYGITDQISLGAGASFLSGLTIDEQLYFINPKVTFDVSKNLHLGASFNWMNLPNTGSLGFLNLAATYGSPRYNVTAGLSYGVTNGELVPQPMVNFGTMLRPTNRVAFMGEVLLVPTQIAVQSVEDFTPFVIVGVRFINKESAFDLGFLLANNDNVQAETALYIPYLSYRHKLW